MKTKCYCDASCGESRSHARGEPGCIHYVPEHMKVTPEHITKLEANEVFVYGSNRAYRHGRGAAKQALKFGAVYGDGPYCGQTYGINTKGRKLEVLSLREIGIEVDRFVRFAEKHPELTFLVTAVGTGLAGYGAKDIAHLFSEAAKLPNVWLPESFWRVINA